MADTKISGLTAATAAPMSDELPANEGGTSKKLTLAQVRAVPYATGSFTVADGFGLVMTKLVLTGSQRATLAGTARLRIT